LAVDLALFVSKRLMPVAAALLLLASGRLVESVRTFATAAPTGEVRVVIGR